MDRVTTFSTYNNVIGAVLRAESNQAQAQQQVATGKTADDLKGYGVDAEALTAAQTLQARTNSFIATAKTASQRLDAQDLALGQVSDASTGARAAIANALASDSADGLVSSLQSFFTQAASGLNTQYNGSYLFAGGRTDTPPVAAKDMSDLTTMTSSQVFQNDQLATTTRLDQSTTVKTGMLADSVGQPLFDAFKQVQAFQQGASGPFSGKLTDAQTTFLTSMLATFDSASDGLTSASADNGLMQNRVDAAQAAQTDRKTMLTGVIGDISSVDMAEAASRLSQSQLALQASAQIFSSLQQNTLLNYLAPPSS